MPVIPFELLFRSPAFHLSFFRLRASYALLFRRGPSFQRTRETVIHARNIYERHGREIYIASHRNDTSSEHRAGRRATLLFRRIETPAFIDISQPAGLFTVLQDEPIHRAQPHSATDKTVTGPLFLSASFARLLLHRCVVWHAGKTIKGLRVQ